MRLRLTAATKFFFGLVMPLNFFLIKSYRALKQNSSKNLAQQSAALIAQLSQFPQTSIQPKKALPKMPLVPPDLKILNLPQNLLPLPLLMKIRAVKKIPTKLFWFTTSAEALSTFLLSKKFKALLKKLQPAAINIWAAIC